MLEIHGHALYTTGWLREFPGAPDFSVGFSDMVGQPAVGDPLLSGSEGSLIFHMVCRVSVLHSLRPQYPLCCAELQVHSRLLLL